MDAKKAAVILATVTIITTGFGVVYWLGYERDVDIATIEAQAKVELSAQETRRLEIFAQLASQVPTKKQPSPKPKK